MEQQGSCKRRGPELDAGRCRRGVGEGREMRVRTWRKRKMREMMDHEERRTAGGNSTSRVKLI